MQSTLNNFYNNAQLLSFFIGDGWCCVFTAKRFFFLLCKCDAYATRNHKRIRASAKNLGFRGVQLLPLLP